MPMPLFHTPIAGDQQWQALDTPHHMHMPHMHTMCRACHMPHATYGHATRRAHATRHMPHAIWRAHATCHMPYGGHMPHGFHTLCCCLILPCWCTCLQGCYRLRKNISKVVQYQFSRKQKLLFIERLWCAVQRASATATLKKHTDNNKP